MKFTGILLLTLVLISGCVSYSSTYEGPRSTGGEAIGDKQPTAGQESGQAPVGGGGGGAPTGEVQLSPGEYVPYQDGMFDAALEQDKVIFLEFYANWCPICANQEPKIEAAFQDITNSDIVGFRVNYKDSDTDDAERDLARRFGITYQHTHVILDRDGNVAIKSLDTWSEERIKEELRMVAGSI